MCVLFGIPKGQSYIKHVNEIVALIKKNSYILMNHSFWLQKEIIMIINNDSLGDTFLAFWL